MLNTNDRIFKRKLDKNNTLHFNNKSDNLLSFVIGERKQQRPRAVTVSDNVNLRSCFFKIAVTKTEATTSNTQPIALFK